MKSTCPECGAQFKGKAGSAMACPSCGNPVAVSQKPAPRERPAAPTTPEAAPVPSAGLPWGTILLVLGLLGAAHYGLYLLITAGARAEIAAIEARHPAMTFLNAGEPGPAPTVGTPAYSAWNREHSLWDAGRRYQTHQAHRDLVEKGLLAAYLVQLGLTGFALFKLAQRGERRRRRNGKSARRA